MTVTMAITIATIGRLIKNVDIIVDLLSLFLRPTTASQIADFKLQISKCRLLQISNCRSQIADLKLQISNSRSQVADLKLQIANLKYLKSQIGHSEICNLQFE